MDRSVSNPQSLASSASSPAHDNVRGILLMLVAMVCFTIEDLFIKGLSATMSVGQILVLLGIAAGMVFFVWLKLQGHRFFAPEAWRPMVVIRGLMEGGSAMAFATALATVDISVVAAVFQATPLAITMGAALFLGEAVGWRRWSAIFVGFAGVVMIIRPGLDGFDPSALIVLVAVIGVAARDLLTKRMRAEVSSTMLSLQAYLSVVLGGAVLMVLGGQSFVTPSAMEWQMLAAGTIFGVVAYSSIVTAMRVAEASAVTPYRYSRLVFSMLGGMIIFAERPDVWTILGAGLIIASGLYTFLRERRLARIARRQAAAA